MGVTGPQTTDPFQQPAGVPPPGVTPNLGNGAPSQQSAIIGVCSTFIILTTSFVALRLYVAFRITKIPALENYLCVIAAAFSFAYMAILMHLSYASRHMWDVPLAWMFADDNYWKLRLSQNLLNPLAFFFSRVPVFMLYSRLFETLQWLRWSCYFGILSAFVIYVHTVPVVATFCTPRPGEGWTDMIVFARCSRAKPDAIAQGIGNIVLDLYALVLPFPVILGLHLPLKKKIGLMVVFLAGSFALIASCVSLYYRVQLNRGNDTNWTEGAYDATSAIEINIAIICSCAPAFASFAKAKMMQGSLFTSFRSLFRSDRSNEGSTFSGGRFYAQKIADSHELQDTKPLTREDF